jgi:hypothetical protein
MTGLRNAHSGPRQIKYSYTSSYAGFNIQLYVSTSILVIFLEFIARYTQHMQPNSA